MRRENQTEEQLFDRLINNRTRRNFWENVHELRRGQTVTVFNRCKALIVSGDTKQVIAGVSVLAQLGDETQPFRKKSVPVFLRLLKTSRDPTVLGAALQALSHNNNRLDAKAVDLICSFKDHPLASVRYGVVCALLGIEQLVAVDTLVLLSDDRVQDIRNWATFGLGTLTDRNNKRIREALWKRVEEKDEETRFEAMLGLARRKDERIKPLLMQALQQQSHGSLLFEAVAATADVSFLPILKKILRASKQDPDIDKLWLERLTESIATLKESQLK